MAKNAEDVTYLRKMARNNVREFLDEQGMALLAPELTERLLVAEAAMIVLHQMSAEFSPAQELIRAVIQEEG